VNRELSRFYKKRFTDFTTDLVYTWAIREPTLGAVNMLLRTIYRRYLGLACLSSVLSLSGQRKDYIRGVTEVSYLGVVLATKGLENPSCVLLRQSIELVTKHIYFANHPVEYHWSATRSGYREISFQFLLDYLRKTDEIALFPEGTLLLTEIERQFGILSRFVHMHSRSFIPYTSTSVRSANRASISDLNQRTGELWPLLICLLVAYFPGKFIAANKNERSVMVGALSTVWHNRFKQYLRAIALKRA
jgi:hypothetical protein